MTELRIGADYAISNATLKRACDDKLERDPEYKEAFTYTDIFDCRTLQHAIDNYAQYRSTRVTLLTIDEPYRKRMDGITISVKVNSERLNSFGRPYYNETRHWVPNPEYTWMANPPLEPWNVTLLIHWSALIMEWSMYEMECEARSIRLDNAIFGDNCKSSLDREIKELLSE
jgi:hypothetical protein